MDETRRVEDARDLVNKKSLAEALQEQELEVPIAVRFLAPVTFSELPETPVLLAQKTLTTIDVINTTRVRLQNTAPVSITNLTNGQEGQSVIFLGDGFTTFVNNTSIGTNTGANKLLASGFAYTFTRLNSKWIEDAPSGSSYTAGTGLVLTGTVFSNPYVGKHVTLINTSVTETISAGNSIHVGATGRWTTRCDTSGMGNIRISSSIDGTGATGNFTLDVFYSTNAGGAWTRIAVAVTVTNAGLQQVSGTLALPAGAKNAATWFTPCLTSSSTTGTCIFYTFAVELTP